MGIKKVESGDFIVRPQSMKICGYSERGVLNSLLYEIHYADNGDKLLAQLVDKATFPFTENKPPSGKATVFVEQSLSDFGDSDAVILIQSCNTNRVIFVEAKVKTCGPKDWSLTEQFSKFRDGLKSGSKPKGFSSNLFTQIYYKQRFMKADMTKLETGVSFPEWSSKEIRKIGTNPVVKDAAKQIKNPCDATFYDATFYLMLIPDNDERVKEFFHETLQKAKLPEVPGWDTSHFGYLTWATVKSFCEQKCLKNTLDAFKYNDGQIY